MPQPGQSGRRKHYVLVLSVRAFVRSSVRYQSWEYDILKASEPISIQIGTSGL